MDLCIQHLPALILWAGDWKRWLRTLAAQGVAGAQPVVVGPALVAASALHVLLAGTATRDRPQRGVRAALAHGPGHGPRRVTVTCYRRGQGDT